MPFLRRVPIHTAALAVYAPLALLALNITELPFSEGLRALGLSFLAGMLLLAASWLLFRDLAAASLAASWLLLLFFAYGHTYNLMEPVTLIGLSLGRHRVLLPVWLLLALAGVIGIRRFRQPLGNWTVRVNGVMLFLLAWQLLPLGTFYWANRDAPEEAVAQSGFPISPASGRGALPDIYYIILDAYSREDLLLAEYGYDNRPFLDRMEALGFADLRCSQSNYSTTDFSLAAALNMDYFESFQDQVGDNGYGFGPLIKRSEVRRVLEAFGYQTVAFETGFYWTQVEDADIYLSPFQGGYSRYVNTGGLNQFEVLFIRSTALLALTDAVEIFSTSGILSLDYPRLIHRERVLFAFEQLEDLPAVPGPKFVFAHIVSPHRPFAFDAEGNLPPDPEADKDRLYIDQLVYLNGRLAALAEHLLTNSEFPPVIIIQGDHSSVRDVNRADLRVRILNLVHLPDGRQDELSPTMTPVNTFRLVLNALFDLGYPLLDDRSFWVLERSPYEQLEIPVPERCDIDD